MASKVSLARPALSNLTVNAVSKPTRSTPGAKESTSRKRRIDEVEEPENAEAAWKDSLSPLHAGGTLPPVEADSMGRVIDAMNHSSACSLSAVSIKNVLPIPMAFPEEAPSPHSTVSSLIDYDPDDTIESQQTAATEVTQPLNGGQATVAAGPSRARQHAETLRLRLRLAQFKVQTNQINTPFSQLRFSATLSQSLSEKTLHPLSSSGEMVEDATAENVMEQAALPQLLSDAQFTSSSQLSSIRESVVPALDPSSSPRKSDSPEKNGFETPVLPRHEMAGIGGTIREDNVTSSVVKGSAAMGLLGLRGER